MSSSEVDVTAGTSREHERDVSIAGKTVHATVDEFQESIAGSRIA